MDGLRGFLYNQRLCRTISTAIGSSFVTSPVAPASALDKIFQLIAPASTDAPTFFGRKLDAPKGLVVYSRARARRRFCFLAIRGDIVQNSDVEEAQAGEGELCIFSAA